MTTPKNPRLNPKDELYGILKGILSELLRIATAGVIDPKPKRKVAVQRLVGASFLDDEGRTIKVVAKDSAVTDRYIVERSDGRCFHLYKSTIKRYLNGV